MKQRTLDHVTTALVLWRKWKSLPQRQNKGLNLNSSAAKLVCGGMWVVAMAAETVSSRLSTVRQMLSPYAAPSFHFSEATDHAAMEKT